jgi:hypothetical protein
MSIRFKQTKTELRFSHGYIPQEKKTDRITHNWQWARIWFDLGFHPGYERKMPVLSAQRDETLLRSNLPTSDTQPEPLNETLSLDAPQSAEVEVSAVGYWKECTHIFLSSSQSVRSLLLLQVQRQQPVPWLLKIGIPGLLYISLCLFFTGTNHG